MRKIGFSIPVILLTLALILAQRQKSKDDGWSELLPPGEARELVLASCISCHNLKSTVHERKNREGWAKTVSDMVLRGAPVFVEEMEPMTEYLSRAFGPDVAKPVNVNTATREELEKLPVLKPDGVTHLIELRQKAGGFKNAEELRQAIGWREEEFEKIRYLLKYRN